MVTISTPSTISEAIGSAVDAPPIHTRYLSLELNRSIEGDSLIGKMEELGRCPWAIVDCVTTSGEGRMMAWFKDPGPGLFSSQSIIVVKVTNDESLADPTTLVAILESISAGTPSSISWDSSVYVNQLARMAWIDTPIPE